MLKTHEQGNNPEKIITGAELAESVKKLYNRLPHEDGEARFIYESMPGSYHHAGDKGYHYVRNITESETGLQFDTDMRTSRDASPFHASCTIICEANGSVLASGEEEKYTGSGTKYEEHQYDKRIVKPESIQELFDLFSSPNIVQADFTPEMLERQAKYYRCEKVGKYAKDKIITKLGWLVLRRDKNS
jgi:hypothetical protein